MFHVISLYSTYTVHKHHRELEFGVDFIPVIQSIHTCSPFLCYSYVKCKHIIQICSNTFLCACSAHNTQIIKDVEFVVEK